MASIAQIVVHGKSEEILFRNVTRRMKTKVEFYSKNDGRESIRISHLVDLFTTGDLSGWGGISRACGYRRLPADTNLRIFTVMDIDGDDRNRTRYKTGDLLRNVPFADRITAIYNEEDLDEVMEAIGYRIDRFNKVSSYNALTKGIDPGEFYRRLRAAHDEDSSVSTNMDVLMRFLLEHEPSFQSRLDRQESDRWDIGFDEVDSSFAGCLFVENHAGSSCAITVEPMPQEPSRSQN